VKAPYSRSSGMGTHVPSRRQTDMLNTPPPERVGGLGGSVLIGDFRTL